MNNRKVSNPVIKYIRNNISMLIALIVMSTIISIVQPRFLNPSNLFNILRSISITGILAFGMTLCIIIGGIDLSQGSVVGFTACMCAWLITKVGLPFWQAIVLSLVTGGLSGVFNGYFLSSTSLPPFVVTLSMQFIARGGCYVITKGGMISVDSSFSNFGNGYLFKVIPNPVLVLAGVALVMFLLLSKTAFGRGIYALGGNREAARFSGINIRLTVWVVYAISGFLAAICGIICCSRIVTGQPTTGVGMEFEAVCACYLGGISYLGGEGNIGSTLLGAITLGVLANGMSMLLVPWYVQNIVQGVIILTAVYIDVMRREKASQVYRFRDNSGSKKSGQD